MTGEGVAVTGLGVISSIGNTWEENLQALQTGKHGLSRIANFPTRLQEYIWVGEVKSSNDELADNLELSPPHSFTRTALLGAYAARQALKSANIDDVNQLRTGFLSSTSVGGMDYTERYGPTYLTSPEWRRYIPSHPAGDSSHKIAKYLGIKGLVTTVSTACSSAANAIMMGARLIRSGRLDRVVVGGTDALSKFTINGFHTLMILSDAPCRPFDKHRNGLNLGEGAAYLVLESQKTVKQQGKNVLAYLTGYGNANDAFHQTASSENGEGAFLAMQKALAVAQLRSQDIDYINVHGTATPNNDLSEGRAMQRIFKNKTPSFSSTKPFTGHTLAAAGAIEAVYSMLALQQDLVFPNLHFDTPMEEFDMIPQTMVQYRSVSHVLSNSFGFGGNCSSLIFSKA
ncbi:beta-ketoacyl-[acyl-carrier-protein] synthase family protein [Sphingobacterium corticibacterium]|uniref:Beta-ketoacyl-[acyl-carrier-protein] synthase family protein n=1 Tax=Sphingobacterium corticibacterium TaxID=2484746 RepID=A0A4Q6XTL3_9SPHI|nr:beta-ketoacyl-[acyl-carrier-protein] synthase family protein [Sphingobacterium corticibacterium]RZF60139.1 beta-ketoacyl-[acyl-carrier-protein] synthase family protein [Sphingobacterium corticibacterium]